MTHKSNILTSNNHFLRFVPLVIPAQSAKPTSGAVPVRSNQLPQEIDVSYCQLQGIYLRQTLFIGKRRDVRPEPFEGVVDGLHSSSFAQIGGLPLLDLLLGASASSSVPEDSAKQKIKQIKMSILTVKNEVRELTPSWKRLTMIIASFDGYCDVTTWRRVRMSNSNGDAGTEVTVT